MAFSYTETWNEAVRMMRREGSALTAVAGVFMFLPALLLAYFAPMETGGPLDWMTLADELTAYYQRNLPWLALENLASLLGAMTMYRLLLQQRGATVGGALSSAFLLLPAYVVLAILKGVMLSIAFMALIVPAIYLLGRIGTADPIMAAERSFNPLRALEGSFRLTRGRGWAVAGLFLVVGLTSFVVVWATTAILGILVVLAAGQSPFSLLLRDIIAAGLGAAQSTVLIALAAAIYRMLSAAPARVPISGT